MELVLYRRRTKELTVTVLAPNGNPILFDANQDVFRLKIGRAGDTPILDLSSTAASDNGSTVESANPSDVHLDDADATLLPPGTYDIEAAIYESNDGEIRGTTPGVLHVIETMGGDVGSS